MNERVVSFIIPFRNASIERERNCFSTLKWVITHYPNCEIILAEHGSKTEFPLELGTINQIYVGNELEPFNKSKIMNQAAILACHDVLIFLDSDIIIDPEDLNRCIISCQQEFEAVNPFNVVIDLPEDLSEMIHNSPDMKLNYPIAEKDKSECRDFLNFSGGMVLIRKSNFVQIGGWPEEFWGWGGEDDVFAYKIERFLKFKTFKNPVYHLYHKRTTYETVAENPEYLANCEAMDRIIRYTDTQLIDYCMKSKEALVKFPVNELLSNPIRHDLAKELIIRHERVNLDDLIEDGKVVYYPTIQLS
ncbi:galactosyltransferase-related protein [Vibrio cionasavignyae]|uniref:galactosyltransferase-related protein n=1 Tax=Vibrio cionasavignyae TaxID=2910252 RepID=UPI003D1021A4